MENNLAVINDPASYPVVSLPSPTQFEAYARAANALPLLGDAAEKQLVLRWVEDQDREAARQLVLAHLRLVVKAVRAHAGYGVSSGDLAQEGTVGLMKAVHRFRPEIGVRLAAFAARWIEAEIREFIFRSWRMVRLGTGSAMRKLFFGYRKTLLALRQWDPERPVGVSSAEIAQAMGVSPDQVEQVAGYFRGQDMSLSVSSTEDEGGQGSPALQQLALEHALADAPASPEDHAMVAFDAAVQSKAMRQAWSLLSARERRILQARRLSDPPVGLKELGEELSISAERVRQIEQAAFSRLAAAAHDCLENPR